ncbi:MAG: peptidase U32 family protein [Bacteroidales bacterium]
MKRSDFEIMSPAGSYESLTAAIQGGADSVYLGIDHLNMRAGSANNFSIDDLPDIVSICNEKGVKTYLTVNIVVYDRELTLMKQVVDAAVKSGISAIIASDIAVIGYAVAAGAEVHLSTQVNITNSEAVKFYSGYADVIVLARELSLDQVKTINDYIKANKITGPSGREVKTEIFIHGALCMAVSGKCYLSLHENNTSANRGTCWQTCRKGYIVTEKETGYELEIDNEYIMSPKDLCTIGFLNKIVDSGVRVMKIEGRARSGEYVRTVTECYNEALNAIIGGTYTLEKIEDWRTRLSTVFNRGFWDGYYLGQRLGEWSSKYGSSATRRKVYLGKVTNYFAKSKVAEIKLETGDLSTGDNILISGPTTGVLEYKIGEIRVDLKGVQTARKGEFCSIPVKEFLRRSDKVYLWVDQE